MGFTKRNARPVAGPGVLGDDQPARKINSRNKLNGRRPQQVSPNETAEERQRLLLAELSMSAPEGDIFHVGAMRLVRVDERARASRKRRRAA
jgi:hypothetical protein